MEASNEKTDVIVKKIENKDIGFNKMIRHITEDKAHASQEDGEKYSMELLIGE